MKDAGLHSFLNRIESLHFEHKHIGTNVEEIAATVCAFLNTEGGTLVVEVEHGISDERIGELKLAVMEKIKPSAFWSATSQQVGGEPLLLIEVPAGKDRPYVSDGKLYVRKGSSNQGSTVAADVNTIQSLVGKTYADAQRWERKLVPNLNMDDLDPDAIRAVAKDAREQRNLKLEEGGNPEDLLSILSLRQENQLTNAADVLFGKRPALRLPQTRVRVVVYDTDKGGDFKDSRIYEGHAFKCMENVFEFILQHIPVRATFDRNRLQRMERPAFPEFAVREGLVNAFVHRDYALFEGGMSVGLYPNRLVIWNTGDLPEGIRIGDLKKEHPSILRNPDIAHVFYLRRYMDRVGRGTQKITEECKAARLPAPKWESDSGGVTLTLFAGIQSEEHLNLRQRKLMREMHKGSLVKTSEYCERMTVSERQGRRDLMELERSGLLIREGEGPATVFRRTGAVWEDN